MDKAIQKKYCNVWMFDDDISEPGQVFSHNDKFDNENSNLSEPGQEMSSNKDKLDSNESTSATDTKTTPTPRSTKSKKRSKPKPKRIPRPLNDFMLYRKAKLPDVLAQNKNLSISDASKIISTMWWKESDEGRFQWKILADKAKLKHMQDYPDYVYQPRRHGTKKQKHNCKPKPILSDETIAAIAEAASAVNKPNHSQALPSSPPYSTILPSPTPPLSVDKFPPTMPPLSFANHMTFYHPYYAVYSQHPGVLLSPSDNYYIPHGNLTPLQSFNPISYISPQALTNDNLFDNSYATSVASEGFNNNTFSYDNCGYGNFDETHL